MPAGSRALIGDANDGRCRVISAMSRALVGAPTWSSMTRSSSRDWREAQHLGDEIVAARRVHPAGAEDEVAAAHIRDSLLALALGRSVDIEWRGSGRSRHKAQALLPSNDVVGRIVDQPGAAPSLPPRRSTRRRGWR